MATIPTTTAATSVATAAAAAADNHLDRYDDEDDTEAQNDDDDALLESHPGGTNIGRNDSIEGPREKAGVLMAIRIMLGTDESASFFVAVVLSGMGSGVIDTFLFIR